ncbi:MAG: hypothetical protein ABS99_06585 [Acetobacteraceae bacterium SCN 69-10]|nr:MAG: hypothetical protein ABS99_06585 [Acetobacteraceae bacterium SCN 69-10]
MNIAPDRLRQLTMSILRASGSNDAEAATVADHLVGANLAGHDSHGVGMLPAYHRSLRGGHLRPNAAPTIVQDSGSFAVWDGDGCYGQVVARDAMAWAIATARTHGVAVHGLRNTHHIGRVGTYGEMAAAAGLLSVQFVNGYGGAPKVAPYRGREGRFSTNPICIAVMAPSRIALGKVRVAYNEGRHVIGGALIDAAGQPTTDPAVIYTEPHGAVLPFGEHKGYGLAMICELLAGAVAGAGTIQSMAPPDKGIINGWLTFVLDQQRLAAGPLIEREIDGLITWAKSAAPADPDLPVLVAGEPERIARAARARDGIEIDATTWAQIRDVATAFGVNIDLA